MVRLTTVTGAGAGTIIVNSNSVLVAGGAHTNAINLVGGVIGSVTGVGSLAGNVTAAAGTLSTIALTDPQDYTPNSEMNFTGNLLGSGNINVVSGSANLGVDGGVGFRLRGTGTSTFSGTLTISNNVKGELQTGVTTPFSPAGTGKIRLVGGDATLGGAVTAATAANGYSELNIRNNSTNHAYLGNDVEMIGSGLAVLNPLGSAPTNAVSTMGNLKIGGGQELGVIRNSGQPQIVAFQSVTLTGGDAVFSPKTPDFGNRATVTGSDLTLSNIAQLVPGCGIVMNGLRTLYLTGTNGFTGNTTISNGVLSLLGSSSLSNSPVIAIEAGAFLSVTGRVGGTLVLANGQRLQGNGTVNGNFVAGAGSILSPGESVGTLALTGTALLQGTAVMEIDKQASQYDILQGAVSLTYGGMLVVSNLNNALADGDAFPLFNAGSYSGSFAAIVPATPGAGLSWNTSTLATDGTLRVVVGAAPQPRIGSVSLSGGNVVLSGTGGPAGGTYSVRASTSVTLPIAQWTLLSSGNPFDGSGNFSFSTPIAGAAQRFFLLQVP
jgi:autotransporter-associated beta strand protein